MVMRDLREKVVNHMSPNVVVDVVDPSVVPVERCQASPQIVPFLIHRARDHITYTISVISYNSTTSVPNVESMKIMNTKHLTI